MKSLSFSTIMLLSICVLGGCAFQAAEPGDDRLSSSSDTLQTEVAVVSNSIKRGEDRATTDETGKPDPTPWRNKAKEASEESNPGQEVENLDDEGKPDPTPWHERRVEVDPYL